MSCNNALRTAASSWEKSLNAISKNLALLSSIFFASISPFSVRDNVCSLLSVVSKDILIKSFLFYNLTLLDIKAFETSDISAISLALVVIDK